MNEHEHVFHAGERAVQDRVGVPTAWRERAARAIRPEMSSQQQAFFESLPLMFLGLQDGQGRPWATILVLSPNAKATATELSVGGLPVLYHRLGLDVQPGAKAAVLGLDFPTRRRSRMNGAIAAANRGGLTIAVEQSFGNCPQYIRTREINRPAVPVQPDSGARVALGDPFVRHIILNADTFFIATCANGGADVSHRGGAPGFVRPNVNGSLSFPDYSGNRFFNTLGNIEVTGRAGLFIPDFSSGDAILLTGQARIDWSKARTAEFDGAERVVNVQPDEVWCVHGAF